MTVHMEWISGAMPSIVMEMTVEMFVTVVLTQVTHALRARFMIALETALIRKRLSYG